MQKNGTARSSMIHECFESFSNTSLTEGEETILKEVAATSYIGTCTLKSAYNVIIIYLHATCSWY